MNPFHRLEEDAARRGYRVDAEGRLFNPRGRRLHPWVHDGYYIFKAGRDSAIRLHRMIAYQKFGAAIYGPDTCVRHLNGNSLDNRPENLALGTNQENMMDKPQATRIAAALKAVDRIRKYDHAVVLQYLAHHTYAQAQKKFPGIAMGTLSFIANRSMAKRGLNPDGSMSVPTQTP